MSRDDKPLVWLEGEIQSPPFSKRARIGAGFLLRLLQQGQALSLPHSRPMPAIGPRCHELRINDRGQTWRIIYRVDPDAVIVLDVFAKKTPKTPVHVVQSCQRRLRDYDRASGTER